MKTLLTTQLKADLPKLNEQEGSDDPIVYAKFFFPASCWTWLVTEGQPIVDDFMFFGYVIGLEGEWGYFTLKELEGVNIRGLVIERDEFFEPCMFSVCPTQSPSRNLKNERQANN